MNDGQKLELLRQLQSAFPRLLYGSYSWKLNGQVVLETVPDTLSHEPFHGSYRIDNVSPWHTFRVPGWQRCLGCPLLDERRWRRQDLDRLPEPEIHICREDTSLLWERVEAACFFRCLARRLADIVSAPDICLRSPLHLRRARGRKRRLHAGPRRGSSLRRASVALLEWQREVETLLRPNPCEHLCAQHVPRPRHYPGDGLAIAPACGWEGVVSTQPPAQHLPTPAGQ